MNREIRSIQVYDAWRKLVLTEVVKVPSSHFQVPLLGQVYARLFKTWGRNDLAVSTHSNECLDPGRHRLLIVTELRLLLKSMGCT